MADINIKVWIDNKGQLYLEDSEGHEGEGTITTKVTPGQTVLWKPKSNGGIISIDKIYKKPGISNNANLMENIKQKSDGNWKCTITSKSENGAVESYGISYSTKNGQQSDDPKMKMVIGSGGDDV